MWISFLGCRLLIPKPTFLAPEAYVLASQERWFGAGPTMDLEKLWKSTLAEIELSVSKPIFQTQFAQTKLVSLEQGVATIGCPNPLMRQLVESRYYSLIKSIVDTRTKQNVSLVFVIAAKTEKLTPQDAGPLFSQTIESPGVDSQSIARRLHIRPETTFDSFAVSTTNHMAYAAATAVAKTLGSAYNPLFLYGGVGVGKTHLMHAVANNILSKKPNTRVVYCMGVVRIGRTNLHVAKLCPRA